MNETRPNLGLANVGDHMPRRVCPSIPSHSSLCLLRSIRRPIKPTRQLRRLNSHHLLRPPCSRLWATYSTNLIGGEARDANVVLTLEDDLNVADFERVGAANFGEFAGGHEELVDEVVGDLEEHL